MAVADTLDQLRSNSADYLTAQVQAQIDALGRRLGTSGATLHAVAEQLSSDPNLAAFSPFVAQGAKRVESFAANFTGRDASELWRDAERYAREQPLIATLAAGAAGFALSRAVKASAKINGGIAR
jgi:hypothetical protein